MKRLQTLTLALLGFGLSAWAADTEVGGIYYTFDEAAGTAQVSYKGSCRCGASTYEGVVNVPATVQREGKTYNVSSIGKYAFASSSKLREVTLPASIESIEFGAFAGCRNLVKVTFQEPSKLKTIGWLAFLSCKQLPAIRIPASVESLQPYAFEMCDALTDVTFSEPSQLKVIERYVFCRTGLKQIALPNGCTQIDDVAFCSNPGIEGILLPASVTKISGRNPFCYNSQVTFLGVEPGNPVYDSRDNCNAIIETATSTLVSGCKESVIPTSVTALGRSSFNHCVDLTEAKLPATIAGIGKYAYLGCTGLTSYTFPSTLVSMADSVFWQATNLDSLVCWSQKPAAIDESDFEPVVYAKATLYVPAGTRQLYRAAPGWRNFASIEEMPRFVKDGVYYELLADGTAQVTAPQEQVPYSGTLVVGETVKSGVESYSVSGLASDAVTPGGDARVVLKGKLKKQLANVVIAGGKGVISISGTDAEAIVRSTSGAILTRSAERLIPMAQGMYVVSAGGATAKVLVE